jgi:hypothetical protein
LPLADKDCSVFVALSRLELEYNDKYFDPARYRNQAVDDRVWNRAHDGSASNR